MTWQEKRFAHLSTGLDFPPFVSFLWKSLSSCFETSATLVSSSRAIFRLSRLLDQSQSSWAMASTSSARISRSTWNIDSKLGLATITFKRKGYFSFRMLISLFKFTQYLLERVSKCHWTHFFSNSIFTPSCIEIIDRLKRTMAAFTLNFSLLRK